MTFQYFKDVTTFEELKRQYKALAFKYHPDREGGSVQAMQRINAEYDELKKRVGNVHETANGKTYTRTDAANVPDNFRKIINAIITFDCRIELCGSWLWVFNAYAYRKQLKDLGFFWCSNKKAWAWTENPGENKYRLSLEEIRRLHGSEVMKEDTKKQIPAAV